MYLTLTTVMLVLVLRVLVAIARWCLGCNVGFGVWFGFVIEVLVVMVLAAMAKVYMLLVVVLNVAH
jgi:hypothetical protein